jgi:glutamate formiminotransferase
MIFGFGKKPQKQGKMPQKAEKPAPQNPLVEKLVECVPNFSVGHDSNVIHQIVDAIKACKVDVADQSYDEDHNRLVVTFLGTPENVLNAAYNAIETATKLIDINKQIGVHPFIGVVDVVPFIPLKNISMNECKEMAKKLGKMVADKLKIPSYMYGEAARNDKFKHLSHIRHGGLHHLKNTIATNDFKPDFGPQAAHPTAGAIAIGARDFLIAFNFNLDSDDLTAAKDIAKRIREKDGGLPGIRALGVPIHSKKNVQVTVNLTHYKTTGLKALWTGWRRNAKQREYRYCIPNLSASFQKPPRSRT